MTTFFKDLERLAPYGFLAVVDLTQVQNGSLNNSARAQASILHDAKITMLLAVLLTLGRAEKHDAGDVARNYGSLKGGRSSLQAVFARFRKSGVHGTGVSAERFFTLLNFSSNCESWASLKALEAIIWNGSGSTNLSREQPPTDQSATVGRGRYYCPLAVTR